MSDTPPASPTPNSSSEQTTAGAPLVPPAKQEQITTPEKSKKPRVKRTWRQRILLTFLTVILVLAVIRMIVWAALPIVLGRVVSFYNLSASYDRIELSVIDGNLNIYNLTLRPKEGGAPVAHTDYIFGNIVPIELFRGRLHVLRAEVDGIDLRVDRNADGSIPLLERFVPKSASTSTSATSAPPKPVNLNSPLKVEAFRLLHVTAHIHDQHVAPELKTDLQVSMSVSDLGVPGKPTRFEISVAADQVLDDLSLKGNAKSDSDLLNAEMSVGIHGLHPQAAAGYLLPSGLQPTAKAINVNLAASLSLAPRADKPGALEGKLAMQKLVALADGQQSIRVDHVDVDIDSFDPLGVALGAVNVTGVRINTLRTKDNLLSAAGVELVKAAPSDTPSKTTPTSGPPFGFSLASLRLADCRIELDDQAVSPATALAVQLNQLSVAAPADGGALAVIGKMQIPGIADSVDLSGSVDPFVARKTANLKLRVAGIRPDELNAYLNPLGLESIYKNGSFDCDLDANLQPTSDGQFVANAHLAQLRLADGSELLGLNDVALKGISVDAKRIHLDKIDITGPTLFVRRDANGEVSLLGLRTRRPSAKSAASASPSESADAVNIPATSATVATDTAPPTPPVPLPRLEIDKFTWHRVHLQFDDQGVSPPQSIAINDVGLEMTHLKFGLDPDDYTQNTGQIKAWLSAPHLVDRFDLTGNVTPKSKALELDFNGNGSGISPKVLASYFAPLGLAPLTSDGTLGFHALLDIGHYGRTFAAGVHLDQFRYADPHQTLLAVDDLSVDNAAVTLPAKGATQIAFGQIAIDHPQVNLSRDADGNMVAAGIQLIPSTHSNFAAETPAPTATTTQSAQTKPTTAPSSLVATLAGLHVHNAEIGWSDAAVSPAVDTTLTSNIDLSHVTLGKPADPADLHLTAAVANVLGQLDIAGGLTTAPQMQAAHLTINAHGLIVGPLQSYLPPGITSTLQDGELALNLDAELGQSDKGGQSATLKISQLAYRDGDTSLAKVGNVTLNAPRIDPEGGAITIDELSTAGIECDVTQYPGGKTRLLGLQLATPPAAAAKPAVKASTATESAVTAPVELTTAPVETRSAAQLVAAATKALPLIRLNKLDLNVSRLTLTDAGNPQADPISVEDLRFFNKSPIECLGKDPEARPASQFELTAKLAPLADHIDIGIKTAPFVREPMLSMDILVGGIRGDGLTKLSPPLRNKIDGTQLTQGQLTAHIEAMLKLERHSPIDFDLTHPFGAEFTASKLQYRASPDGPVLAGFDDLHTEGVKVVPHTGDVHVKAIELTNLTATATREKDGIHALGWILKLPAPTTQPTTRSAVATSVPASKPKLPAPSPVASATPPINRSKPSNEISIDNISISGLNLLIQDNTTKPITVIPMNGLDAEVRDLSSLAPYEDKPFRFSVLLNGGKISLPRKDGKGMEQRDILSQITASGKVGLYPELNGWSKLSVSAFEMPALTGEAAVAKIALTQGTFDMDADLRFEPDNVIDVSSKAVVTDLQVAEPDNGPIRRALGLSVPLNIGIAALQDADGSITLPLNFHLKNLQLEGIGSAVAGAVGSVLTTAIASTPLKAVELFAGAPTKIPEKPIVLGYLPGVVLPDAQGQSAVAGIVGRMVKEPNLDLTVTHSFSTTDLVAIAARANPSTSEAQSLAYQLRQHKLELSQLRSEVAGEAEAQLGLDDSSNAQSTLDRLKAIDQEIARTETALDRTYEILRPGADKQADRRTKAFAIEIANQREAFILQALRSAGIEKLGERVKFLKPAPTATDNLKQSQSVIQPVPTK